MISICVLESRDSGAQPLLSAMWAAFSQDRSISLQKGVQGLKAGVVVAFATDKESLILIKEVCRQLKPAIDKKTVKLVVVSPFLYDSAVESFKAMGCSDVFDPQTQFRVFHLKLMQHVHAVSLVRLTEDHVSAKDHFPVEVVDPLSIPSDCWTIGKLEEIKKVLGNWVVSLVGPGPDVGEWVENGEDWEWTPKHLDKYKSFISQKGTWRFRGRKPRYKNQAWMFTGSYPRLQFVMEEGPVFTKFNTRSGRELVIAADSIQGQNCAKIVRFNAQFKEQEASKSRAQWDSNRHKRILEELHPVVGTKTITDPQKIESYFSEAIETRKTVWIWEMGKRTLLSPQMYSFDAGEGVFKVVLLNESEASAAHADITENKFFVVIDLRRVRIQFQADLVRKGISQFSFKIPKQIILIQRRSQFRLDLSESLAVEFSSPSGETVQASASDVSASGMGFEISTQNPKQYLREATLEGFNFELAGRVYQVQARVCHAHVVDEKDGFFRMKIGVQFQGDADWGSESLNSYVLNRGKEYLSRYMK